MAGAAAYSGPDDLRAAATIEEDKSKEHRSFYTKWLFKNKINYMKSVGRAGKRN